MWKGQLPRSGEFAARLSCLASDHRSSGRLPEQECEIITFRIANPYTHDCRISNSAERGTGFPRLGSGEFEIRPL